ncbi:MULTISPECIES: iron-containing redox enzyme family protein [unclassified Pseudomonas]|uniref:iron-containing redox enzyme family protein n=1 Tax=unclassified Pseudomonas TaxID=196821 RepID=UPI001CBED06B|nr:MULTISPECIES: iron-containing redox enzyme family protein [unclassified Pseudomonas]
MNTSALCFTSERINSTIQGLIEQVTEQMFTGNSDHFHVLAVANILNQIDRFGALGAMGDSDALYEIHKALYHVNEMEVAHPTPQGHKYQFNPIFLSIRSRLEHWADSYENARRPANLKNLGVNETLAEIINIWKTHNSANHPIFEYVRTEATKEAVLEYLKSDYLLNIRFYDLVVYSLVGIDERVRFEVAHNLWDEVGQGDLTKTHVQLYRDLLKSEGINANLKSMSEHLSWQGLAGYNLMMRHGLHKGLYFESLGSLAVTELADPEQYKKFVEGCRRVGVGTNNAGGLAYYEEHISVDVIHGEGWLENVIRPLLESHPESSHLMLWGVYQRLNTAKDYWDELLGRLKRIDAHQHEKSIGVIA